MWVNGAEHIFMDSETTDVWVHHRQQLPPSDQGQINLLASVYYKWIKCKCI